MDVSSSSTVARPVTPFKSFSAVKPVAAIEPSQNDNSAEDQRRARQEAEQRQQQQYMAITSGQATGEAIDIFA